MLYITCEADLDLSISSERLLARLATLCDGTTPVSAHEIAVSLRCDLAAVQAVLRRAAHSGLVREVVGKLIGKLKSMKQPAVKISDLATPAVKAA